MLSRIVFDTTGLASGPYQVSLFDPNVSDASGFINGNQEASLIAGPPNGTINLNASSSLTAVPEPSSILSIVCIGCIGLGVRRLRRRGAAYKSASHRHEVGGDAGPVSLECS